MADDRIAEALRDASDTRAVVVEAGALATVERVFAECFGDAAAVVIADETTMALAGAAVDDALRAAGRDVEAPQILPARPALYADYDNVTAVAAALGDHEAIPGAVGSGAVHDPPKPPPPQRRRPDM